MQPSNGVSFIRSSSAEKTLFYAAGPGRLPRKAAQDPGGIHRPESAGAVGEAGGDPSFPGPVGGVSRVD